MTILYVFVVTVYQMTLKHSENENAVASSDGPTKTYHLVLLLSLGYMELYSEFQLMGLLSCP